MALESSRKLGLTASLINVIMPVVAVVGSVALIFSIIATAVTETRTGSTAPNIFGLSLGLFGFIIALASVAIVGFILFMVSMHRLANYYNEPGIFKNVLYAFLLSVISAVVIFVLEFALIISSLTRNFLNSTTTSTSPVFSIIYFLVVLVVAVSFTIINGWLYMRAFNKLKEKSGVDSFGTAGILYLVGSIIPIVSWIAWIFAAIGFSKLKPAPASNASYFAQPLTTTMQTKRCPNCGKENGADALYCTACGRPLQ